MDMSTGFTRRNFMKVAGATAGVAIAAGYSPFSYAANEKVRVACIGTGGQGGFHIRYGLSQAPNIEIVAVCDVYKPHLNAGWEAAGGSQEGRDIKKYLDYRKMLDEVECDAVVISTPLDTHHQITMDCLDAGKYCFTEKTLCYTVEECRDIVKKCHETGLFVQVGHQRRYNPEYNKCVWLSRGSAERPSLVGRINHIDAQWHRNNDWRRPVDHSYVLSEEEKQWITDLERHINWRLYEERSGGLATELLAHQIDVATWFLGAMPSRVHGYGGIDYWRDGRTVSDNINLVFDFDIDRDAPSFAMIPKRNDFQSIAQINRPYNVRFTYSSICANAKRGYSELILGDRGAFETTEQQGCTFFAEPAAKENWNQAQQSAEGAAEAIVQGKSREMSNEAYTVGEKVLTLMENGETYPGGVAVDAIQFAQFAQDIQTGGMPKANQMVGLMSAINSIAAVEAVREGKEVTIDKALYTFDFETPDPYRFDFYEDPNYLDNPATQAETEAEA